MGDFQGHPFRGNQWTGGATVTALKGTEQDVERFRAAWDNADLTRIGLPDARKGATVALRTTGGFYREGSDVLAINPGNALSQDELVEQVTHELAHRVWAVYMTEPQRQGWRITHRAIKEGIVKAKFVNAYAGKDPEEDFAESVVARSKGSLKGLHAERLGLIFPWTPARNASRGR